MTLVLPQVWNYQWIAIGTSDPGPKMDKEKRKKKGFSHTHHTWRKGFFSPYIKHAKWILLKLALLVTGVKVPISLGLRFQLLPRGTLNTRGRLWNGPIPAHWPFWLVEIDFSYTGPIRAKTKTLLIPSFRHGDSDLFWWLALKESPGSHCSNIYINGCGSFRDHV